MIKAEARSGDATLDQWFTPFWAAEELTADALAGLGRASICEPACGTGAFLAAVPADCPAFGIDIDPRVVAAAIANSGREVLVGDFRTIDLAGRSIDVILGNPPFQTALIDQFLARAEGILPADGLCAMILPAYTFKTARRIADWQERFSIDVALAPQTLFPKLSTPIVWAKFRKAKVRRFCGLILFAEQRDVELMRRPIAAAIKGPGTWRAAVRAALEALGGEASLAAIYDMIIPARRVARPNWQAKVRQILQLYFRPIERGRWAI